jgi:4-amino-4-deoxychorismate mutase
MEELSEFRRQLDVLDEELMRLLSRRFHICRAVAEYKASADIPMMQSARVAEVKQRALGRATDGGVGQKFTSDLYDLIISEACRIEDEIIAKRKVKPILSTSES